MNLDVYRNRENDRIALKKALLGIELAQSNVDQLEHAVIFGRCVKCDTALDNKKDVLCDDCIGDTAAVNNVSVESVVKTVAKWSDIIREPSSDEPTNEQKYKDVEKRIEVFNNMVDAGKIPLFYHCKHINIDYLTTFDINILWLYVPSE